MASRPAKGDPLGGFAALRQVLQEEEGLVELQVQSGCSGLTLSVLSLHTAENHQSERAPLKSPNSQKKLQRQRKRPGMYAAGSAASGVGRTSVDVSVPAAWPRASELALASSFGISGGGTS